MKNLINKFFAKPYTCCMEQHNQFYCYCSIDPPCSSVDTGGAKEFFEKYHYTLIYNMFDPEWEDKIKLEEIYKKLILIYELDPKNENLIIVYNEEKIYIPGYYVIIPKGGIFVYDQTKIKVTYP